LSISPTDNSDGTHYASLGYNNTDNKLWIRAKIGNTVAIASIGQVDTILNQFYKIAIKYKSGENAIYVNGQKLINTDITDGSETTTFTATPGTISNLEFRHWNDSNSFYGKAKALAVYKEALTDANLRCLTYPNPVATTFDLDFDTIAEQFTFTRGSEATFVNEQGLIESTNQIGPELVTNGDFSNGLTDWSVNGGSYATIVDGALNSNNTVNGSWFAQYIGQNVSFVNGNTYKITFKAKNISGNSNLRITHQSHIVFTDNITSSFVDYEVYYTAQANNGSIRIFCNDSIGEFEIDNVSVKEVISATNTPRIDYSTGEKAFLLEPQSTNLITYSEDFGQSYWNLVGGDKTSGQLSPNGDNSAYRIDFNGSDIGNFFRSADITLTADTTYTASWYIKNINLNDITRFRIETISGGGTGAVNIDTLQDYGTIPTDKFTRYSITFTTGNASGQYRVRVMQAGSSNNTNSFIIANAQLEQQSYATSYIPTNGAIATRNQELCNNATPVINSEEGILYAEISALANDETNRYITISDGSNTNYIRLTYTTTSNQLGARYYVNGSFQCALTHSLTDETEFIKAAFKWKENDFALWVNGVEVATDTSGNVNPENTFYRLDFSRYDGIFPFNSNTKDLKVYPKALADVQLEDLTTITLDTIFGSTFDITFN
jgi:hypothetical protein